MSPDSTAMSPSVANSNPSWALVRVLKWFFSFPAMLGTVLLACLLYQLREFRVDTDVWWHIKLGQDIASTHYWPTSDPYSFTVHGTPWIAYEWLGDMALGFVARFGLQGLEAMLMVLAALVTVALYYYGALCARNAKAGFVAAMVVSPFAVANFNLRPQMFGALFLATTLIILELWRRGRSKALLVLPPLFLVWVNTHGSWIIGIGVILVTLASGLFAFRLGGVNAVRWTEKQRIQLELVLLGSLAVIPATPYGTQLATYPFFVASSLPLNLRFVMEWFPMPFNLVWGKFFLVMLAGAAALQTIYPFEFRLQQLILAIGGIVMACLHVRFVLLFAPFFAPILGITLSRWFDRYRPEKDKFVLNGILMAAAISAIVWYFPSRSEMERNVEKQFPARAVNFVRQHPVQGPMFNNYGYGGYLVAYLPEHKVFIDGREDLYEFGGVMSDYIQVAMMKPAAFSVLHFYGIRSCMLESGEPLAFVLAELPGWRPIYRDDRTVIFERADSVNAAVAYNAQQPSSGRSAYERSTD